jgi:hypothetical protein
MNAITTIQPGARRVNFAPSPDEPIVEHVVYYATDNGWHGFPVPLGTKASHKSAKRSDGRKWGATLDPDEIRRDFKRWPDANVGIVCGELSGIFVVEADTKEGHDVDGIASLAALEAEHGALPSTLQAESPSGSIHHYFRHPGFKIKNSASAIAPGVDVRGDGGMVVAPPSVKSKSDKRVYRWRNDLPIADAPQWPLDLIVAGKEESDPESESELTISERAEVLVRPPDGYDDLPPERGECDRVMRGPKGQRNVALNDAALALGHYVGSGVLNEKEVIDTLLDVCRNSGLLADDTESQCLATIKSGMSKGKSEPKGIPERAMSSQSSPAPADIITAPDGSTAPAIVPPPDSNATPSDIVKSEPAPASSNVTQLKPSPVMRFTLFDDVESFVDKHWLIKGVIAKGDTSLWIAPPGRLKSALMVDLSIHLASGTDWRGYRSKERCGCVYFALERGDLTNRRLAAHKRRDGLSGLPIAVVPGIINLMNPGCAGIIVATIRALEDKFGCSVGFTVFDTLAKGIAAGGGDENQAKDMGAALANLRRVQELTGTHVAIVSHTGKDEKRGARGSNSQDGDIDVLVQISGEESVKVATVTKANDQEEGELTKFKGEKAVMRIDEDGDEVATFIISTDDCGTASGKSKSKAKLTDTEQRAMDMLYNAINDGGKDAPAAGGFPYGVKVVPVEVWRTNCQRGGLSNSGSEDAARQAFYRVSIALANKGKIGMLDGYVWVAYD